MRSKYAFGISDLAEAGPLKRTSLYKAIQLGELKARKFGKRTIILSEDWVSFLKSLPIIAHESVDEENDLLDDDLLGEIDDLDDDDELSDTRRWNIRAPPRVGGIERRLPLQIGWRPAQAIPAGDSHLLVFARANLRPRKYLPPNGRAPQQHLSEREVAA